MCDRCDWSTFVADCDDALDQLDDLPDRAADFADSVREKITGMRSWAEDEEHVTPGMLNALDNMLGGIERWQR